MASPGEIVVDAADVSDGPVWDAYVSAHADATVYHLWRWRAVIEHGLGHRCPYLIARTGGNVRGVLPLAELRSRIFGRALSSLPYVNYGGVLASDDASARALLDAAVEQARERRLSYVLLRHIKRQFQDLPVRGHKVGMTLPLAGSEQTMWDGLDRKVRNQIRKAEKSGVAVTSGGVELLDEFYPIFSRNMHDLGTPVYGRELFAEMLRMLPVHARLHMARLGGRPIAGALTISFRDSMEVPSASSLNEFRGVCANHLVYWTMIREAVAQGCSTFDFGRCTPGEGNFRFKEQWGARPRPLPWEYAFVDGSTPVFNDDSEPSRFRAGVSAWRMLPLPVASALGPHIVRLVP